MNEALMYAKYNQAGNREIYNLLSKMSNEEREKDRGSFYGSLSGLFRHVLGGTWYFLGMFKTALKNNTVASKAIAGLPPMPEEGPLSEAQWKELGQTLEKTDAAYADIAEALSETDLRLPVELDWYGGNPSSVPVSFMLSQLLVHNTHHRGQISQVLDALKIDNDFSGINIALLNKGYD
jgi:uncharacterized damage-inducible protein DinB